MDLFGPTARIDAPLALRVAATPGGVYDARTMRAQHLAMLGSLALAGCLGSPSSGSDNGPVTVDLSVPAIEDVNETSETFGQAVHPNDYLGKASAWYFGHST